MGWQDTAANKPYERQRERGRQNYTEMGERKKAYIPEETERKPKESHKEERKSGGLWLDLGNSLVNGDY